MIKPTSPRVRRERDGSATTGRPWIRLAPPLVALGLMTGFWYLVSYVLLDEDRRFLLPPPHRVFDEAVFDFGEWAWGDNLSKTIEATLLTGRTAVAGFVIAAVLGIAIAALMNLSIHLERAIYPYAVALQVVPILALVPLIGFWWGFEFRSRVIACVLIALFPVIANTLLGLKSVDHRQHDLFTLANASRWQRFAKLELPAAQPAIFTGLRIAAGGSVIGAIVGDFFFRRGEVGVGRLIDNYSKTLQTEDLIVAVVLASFLGIVFYSTLGFVARRSIGRWHESEM